MAESEVNDGAEEAKPKKKRYRRDEDLSADDDFLDDLTKVRDACEKAYTNQIIRTSNQADYWDIYDCELNENQKYDGNNQAYISIGADAIDARQIRFTNQLFPMSGRFIDVITQDGQIPHAEMALLEHYIDRMKLKTMVIAPLCKNGDIEGQYNLYVGWRERIRHVTSHEFNKEGQTETEAVTEEEVSDAGPYAEVIADSDIAVWPPTAPTIEDALALGGGVSITRRWTKARVEQLEADGEITKDAMEKIMSAFSGSGGSGNAANQKNIEKSHVSATGIKGVGSYYQAREIWHMLDVNGSRRIVRSYMGTQDEPFLGTKLNQFWSDLIPIFSCPVKKVAGAFKGSSMLKRVASLCYAANDFLNEALDSATYSMLPIVMTDPNTNPKTASMILDLAAVWEVDPKSTQFAKFPELWQQGFGIIADLKNQVNQSLGVNPSMMPMSSGKKKPSQAEIANEQAVDILTTSDSVSILEEGILSPMVRFIVALDMQYRNDELLVPMYGMMGQRAKLERIKPLADDNVLSFKWLGVQAARNAAQIQQQIALLATVMKVPPNLYQNRKLDLTAFLEQVIENTLGPRLAPLTFIDMQKTLTVPWEEENKALAQNVHWVVSPMDDDKDHIVGHSTVDTPEAKQHIQDHMKQMQAKAVAAMMQAAQQQGIQYPGQQGGQMSRPGAQPGQARPGQQPPGAMHQDRMPAAGAMPIGAMQ